MSWLENQENEGGLEEMATDEVKEKIFTRLCEEYKKAGSDGWFNWENLGKELAIREEEVYQALTQLRSNGRDLYIELDRTHRLIRLGLKWRGACGQGQNPN